MLFSVYLLNFLQVWNTVLMTLTADSNIIPHYLFWKYLVKLRGLLDKYDKIYLLNIIFTYIIGQAISSKNKIYMCTYAKNIYMLYIYL